MGHQDVRHALQFGLKKATVRNTSLCDSEVRVNGSVRFLFEHQETGRAMHGVVAKGQVRVAVLIVSCHHQHLDPYISEPIRWCFNKPVVRFDNSNQFLPGKCTVCAFCHILLPRIVPY